MGGERTLQETRECRGTCVMKVSRRCDSTGTQTLGQKGAVTRGDSEIHSVPVSLPKTDLRGFTVKGVGIPVIERNR